MTSILGAATKMIAALTIILALVYVLFVSLVGPLQPDPDVPTFAGVQNRLETGETAVAREQFMRDMKEMQGELMAADPEDREEIQQRFLKYQQQRALEAMTRRMNQ